MDMEKKYTPFITIGFIIVALFAVLVFARLHRTPLASPEAYNEVSPSAELALDFNAHRHYVFSRDDCIHCANLENYLNSRPDARAKLDLETANLSNANTSQYFFSKAVEFAELCQQDTTAVSTPFLYINDESVPMTERCIIGDTSIINYIDSILPSVESITGVSDGNDGTDIVLPDTLELE